MPTLSLCYSPNPRADKLGFSLYIVVSIHVTTEKSYRLSVQVCLQSGANDMRIFYEFYPLFNKFAGTLIVWKT